MQLRKSTKLQVVKLLVLAMVLPLLAVSGPAPVADAAVQSYSTSWIGDTFGGDTKWMQNFIWSMAVNDNGRVFTCSHWDESHRECGIYENGDVYGKLNHYGDDPRGNAVAVNDTHAFASKGTGAARYGFDGLYTGPVYDVGHSPTALAANGSYVVATDAVDETVKVFDVDSGTLLHSWSVNQPGSVAMEDNGEIWVASNVTRQEYDGRFWEVDSANPAEILHFEADGTPLSGTITGPSNDWIPTALAFDNQGRLMIGDNGPNRQIYFYDVSGTPTQVDTFGTQGGIGAGTPGEVTPTKFFGITGVGTDASGNIYVSLSEHGSILRKLSPTGDLIWEIIGVHFVDVADVDPASDGLDIYSKQEHFSMDYSQPAGQEWTMEHYTLDSVQYPEDPRLWMPNKDHHYTSPFMRRLNGDQLYMYGTGMYSAGFVVHRFDGHIAVPSVMVSGQNWYSEGALNWPPNQPASGAWIWRDADGQGDFDAGEYTAFGSDIGLNWTWWVDSNGDIWATTNSDVLHFPVQGFDTHGNPIYDFTSMEEIPNPAPFNDVRRLIYDAGTDTMYLIGYTSNQPYDPSRWGEAGKVLARYNDWSTGNRTASYELDLPWDLNASPEVVTQSVAIAGDYIFTVGVQTRGKVWIFDKSDGSSVGELIPGSIVCGAGQTGWVDVPYGLNVFQRANGEYLVLVEENARGKVLLYRATIGGSSSGEIVDGGIYKVINQGSGKALDVYDQELDNGANVHQWEYLGQDNQKWQFEELGNGYYQITAVHSGKALEVVDEDLTEGANVQQWEYIGADNQQWLVEKMSDGSYKLTAKHSGMVLDVYGGYTTDGANVRQWGDNGSNAQRWELTLLP